MSLLKLYALHDSKAKMYNRPMPSQNDETSIRGFMEAAIKPDTDINNNPSDYSLFRIGTYDEETSILTPETPPEFLISAEQAILTHNENELHNKLKAKEKYGSLIEAYEKMAIEITAKSQQLDDKLTALNKELEK